MVSHPTTEGMKGGQNQSVYTFFTSKELALDLAELLTWNNVKVNVNTTGIGDKSAKIQIQLPVMLNQS